VRARHDRRAPDRRLLQLAHPLGPAVRGTPRPSFSHRMACRAVARDSQRPPSLDFGAAAFALRCTASVPSPLCGRQGRSREAGAGEAGAEEGSRTPMPLRALDPESSASANSATSAQACEGTGSEVLPRTRVAAQGFIRNRTGSGCDCFGWHPDRDLLGRRLPGIRTRKGAEPPPIDRAPHHGCAGRVKGQPAKRRPLGHCSSSVRQLGLHPFLEGRRSRGCAPCLDSGRAHDCSFGPVRLELILQWVKPKLGFRAHGRNGIRARSGPRQKEAARLLLRPARPPARPAAKSREI
jgi:hypothetical protein